MPTISQSKRPNEILRLAADFQRVLVPGDSLIGGNISVLSFNALTDITTTASIIQSSAVSGTSIVTTVQAGAAGETHRILFRTGLTTLGLRDETEMHLVITENPASENPLISREDAKLHLRVTDTSDDALIEQVILAASSYIRGRTGRDFNLLRYAEVLQPRWNENLVRLQLANYPVQIIEKVESFDQEGILLWTTTNSNDWDYVQEGYIWMTNADFQFSPWPWKNIVTYRAGFLKIPEDLTRCCAQIVAILYRGIGKEGLSEEQIGHYRYRVAGSKDLPKSLRREFNDTQIEGVVTRYMRHDMYVVGA
jgi:hypothetical protein